MCLKHMWDLTSLEDEEVPKQIQEYTHTILEQTQCQLLVIESIHVFLHVVRSESVNPLAQVKHNNICFFTLQIIIRDRTVSTYTFTLDHQSTNTALYPVNGCNGIALFLKAVLASDTAVFNYKHSQRCSTNTNLSFSLSLFMYFCHCCLQERVQVCIINHVFQKYLCLNIYYQCIWITYFELSRRRLFLNFTVVGLLIRNCIKNSILLILENKFQSKSV